MDRFLLYFIYLVIFGVLTLLAQFGFTHQNESSVVKNHQLSTVAKDFQQTRHYHYASGGGGNGRRRGNSNNCTTGSVLLAVPRHQAVFLHIGKAAGGTFMHRARHGWKLQIEECHPDPCHFPPQQDIGNINAIHKNDTMTAIVSIRDPVDRFVSAFYWKIKTICTRYPNLCANTTTRQQQQQQQQDLHRHRPPPPTSFVTSGVDSSLDLEAMQRYILFEKYQQSVNALAESLCTDNNHTAFVDAKEHVGMIAHMKHSIYDWLAEDWDVMVENNSSSSNSSSNMSRMRRSIHSIRPIVLELDFDLGEQIDDALRAIATREQIESKEDDGCPRRHHPSNEFDEQEPQHQFNHRTARHDRPTKRHVHSSLQNSNSILSEKGTRCVAQFYRQDYAIIRQLSHSSTCEETCRLALQSMWNRRSPLLSLDP